MSSTGGSFYKKNKYQKSNAKHWCEFCRIYVYDNTTSRTRHDNSPQHKAAISRKVARLEREEKEQGRIMKSLSFPTLSKLSNERRETFYSAPVATTVGSSSSSSSTSVSNILTMKGGAVAAIFKKPKVNKDVPLGAIPESYRLNQDGENDGKSIKLDPKEENIVCIKPPTKEMIKQPYDKPALDNSKQVQRYFDNSQLGKKDHEPLDPEEAQLVAPPIKLELRKIARPSNLRR